MSGDRERRRSAATSFNVGRLIGDWRKAWPKASRAAGIEEGSPRLPEDGGSQSYPSRRARARRNGYHRPQDPVSLCPALGGLTRRATRARVTSGGHEAASDTLEDGRYVQSLRNDPGGVRCEHRDRDSVRPSAPTCSAQRVTRPTMSPTMMSTAGGQKSDDTLAGGRLLRGRSALLRMACNGDLVDEAILPIQSAGGPCAGRGECTASKPARHPRVPSSYVLGLRTIGGGRLAARRSPVVTTPARPSQPGRAGFAADLHATFASHSNCARVHICRRVRPAPKSVSGRICGRLEVLRPVQSSACPLP